MRQGNVVACDTAAGTAVVETMVSQFDWLGAFEQISYSQTFAEETTEVPR